MNSLKRFNIKHWNILFTIEIEFSCSSSLLLKGIINMENSLGLILSIDIFWEYVTLG